MFLKYSKLVKSKEIAKSDVSAISATLHRHEDEKESF